MASVSILIPCYNAERWVAQAIQSALDQTHEDKEVIVVDDGSTDGSLEVIKSFGDKIRWETGPNRGGNVARNRLLELADGEWLQYLDADDYLLKNKVSDQLEYAADTDIVYSPVLIETWIGDAIADMTPTIINTEQPLLEQWIRWKVAQTGAVIWRREALVSIGGWNEGFPCCQDNEVTLRAIKAGLKFTYHSEADAGYRVWSRETVCHRNPAKVIETRTKLIEEMIKWLGTQSMSAEEQGAVRVAREIVFEHARTLAQTSLDAASSYLRHQQIGKPLATPEASPWTYRLVFAICGFRVAEALATWQRNIRVRLSR